MKTELVNMKYSSYDIAIDRRSKWGNPFYIGRDGDREEVIKKYKRYILNKAELIAALPELAGKRLGCYCKPLACHGDVLIELIEMKESTQYE